MRALDARDVEDFQRITAKTLGALATVRPVIGDCARVRLARGDGYPIGVDPNGTT